LVGFLAATVFRGGVMAAEERKTGGRKHRNLAVAVPASTEGSKLAEKSYNVEAGVFIKDNIAINATGVFMKDAPKAFTVRTSMLARSNCPSVVARLVCWVEGCTRSCNVACAVFA